MSGTLRLRQIFPKDSKLDKLLSLCHVSHELHLHELNDGALSMLCFQCPFHVVLTLEEEGVVREQMKAQDVAISGQK